MIKHLRNGLRIATKPSLASYFAPAILAAGGIHAAIAFAGLEAALAMAGMPLDYDAMSEDRETLPMPERETMPENLIISSLSLATMLDHNVIMGAPDYALTCSLIACGAV